MTENPDSTPSLSYADTLELTQLSPGHDSRSLAPDRRDGRVYVLDEWLKLSVEVALATGRPLLLRGDPGSGKSSLAAFIARNKKWRYYEHTMTSETRVRDLLWRWDAVRRLSDAQVRQKDEPLIDAEYVEPGVLWWAYDPASAQSRGAKPEAVVSPALDPDAKGNEGRSAEHAVVLIDEIDKADPTVPNGLLEPLASMSFTVEETRTAVRATLSDDGTSARRGAQHLIVITTNEERELPPAFLRRCIVHTLEHPATVERLVYIARLHLAGPDGDLDPTTTTLCTTLAERLLAARQEQSQKARRKPSTAEYLDAVRACLMLEIVPSASSETWQAVERATWLKALD